MSNDKNIKLETKDIVFKDSAVVNSVIKKTFEVECYNEKKEKKIVSCSINSDHRKVKVLESISYPFSNFALSGYDMDAILEILQGDRKIADNVISTDEPVDLETEYGEDLDQLDNETRAKLNQKETPGLSVNFTAKASWNFINNVVKTPFITSSVVSEEDDIQWELPEETCIKVSLEDQIYLLEIPYTCSTVVKLFYNNTLQSLNETVSVAHTILPGYALDTVDSVVKFEAKDKVVIKFLKTNIAGIEPIACKTINQEPEPGPNITFSDQNRYAISNKNGLIFLDNFPFTNEQWKLIADYSHEQIYSGLVTEDDCFKMKIWIIIPLFFPIIVPLWVNVKIFNALVNIGATVATTLADQGIAAVEMAQKLKEQINVQNAVKATKKATGVAKALINGDLNDELVAVAENLKRIAKELVDTTTNYNNYEKLYNDVKKAFDKLDDIIRAITDLPNAFGDAEFGSLESIGNTAKKLQKVITDVLDVVKEFVRIVKDLPKNVASRHLKKVVQSVEDLIKYVYNFVQQFVELIVLIIKEIDFPLIIEKLADIPNKISNINIDLSLLQNVMDQVKSGNLDLNSILDDLMKPFIDAGIIDEELIERLKGAIIIDGADMDIDEIEVIDILLSPLLSKEVVDKIKEAVTTGIVDLAPLLYEILKPILQVTPTGTNSNIMPLLLNFSSLVFNFDASYKLERAITLTDVRQAKLQFMLTVLEDLGADKLMLSALEKADQQEQTALEAKIEAAALEKAAMADKYHEEAMKALKIKEIEAMQMQQLYKSREYLDQGLDIAKDLLTKDVEEEKRKVISNTIRQFLNQDIYQISKFGKFDPEHPDEVQIVFNDINGVRLYTKKGELLWSNTKLCQTPFIDVPLQGDQHGCHADSTPCGQKWDCNEKNYWFRVIKYRVSFNFMNNHDLAFAGIRIGDFDGDGIDDLWCHYPHTTKGFNMTGDNKIVFSPLKKNFNLTLEQENWCSQGIVKIGDFNGDKKDDSLCISDEGFFLLYSDVASFTPAINNADGKLSLSINVTDWDKTKKIVVADIDGDQYSDLVKIEIDTVDILYGHKANYFVSQPSITSKFLLNQNSTQIKECYDTDINRIMSGDLNHDKKDDIVCISRDSTQTPIILYTPEVLNSESLSSLINDHNFDVEAISSLSYRTNLKKKATVIIQEIKLHDFNNEEIQKNTNIKYKTTNNFVPGDQKLISYFDSNTTFKTVENVHYSFGCYNTVDYDIDISMVLETSYMIPDNLLWYKASQEDKREIAIEMSAQWVNDELVYLHSNPLVSFSNFIDNANGLAYSLKTASAINTLRVNFDAKAKIYIEEGEELLSGQNLINSAKELLNNAAATIDNDGTSFCVPLSGNLNLNVLGFGYEEVVEGN